MLYFLDCTKGTSSYELRHCWKNTLVYVSFTPLLPGVHSPQFRISCIGAVPLVLLLLNGHVNWAFPLLRIAGTLPESYRPPALYLHSPELMQLSRPRVAPTRTRCS